MSELRVNRRQVFGYASAAGIGTAAGVVTGRASANVGSSASGVTNSVQRMRYSPFGEHQPGIRTSKPAASHLVAFDLLPDTDVAELAELMRVWARSIAALMQGEVMADDLAPDFAQEAVSLTITVGWGPRVFELDGMREFAPEGFEEIPPMDHDALQERWNGGDLLVMISADDSTSITYAARKLTVDAQASATPRWAQPGFWRGTDADGAAVTGRNLMGQVDGTANPVDDELEAATWVTDGWFAGGTQLVIRRIEISVDQWEPVSRDAKERVIGRDLATGAPLTGGEEHDEMDLDATDGGRLVIPLDAHARLSHPSQNAERTMLRRGWNYTHVDDTGLTSHGLIFLAFQHSITETFVPVQRKLDLQDALNEWTTAIGSAVFAILPGWHEGEYPGHTLLEHFTDV